MPGAFAHITAVNVASSTNNLDSINLNDEAYDALLSWLEFVELGAVSPDYPYLAMGEENTYWADLVHTDYKTSSVILTAIDEIRSIEDDDIKQKAFAWLCGFVSHIVADVVIHPVVELKVGPYEENKKEHRICEMHQDSFIYKEKLNLGEIGMAEHLKSGIATCNHDGDKEFIFRPVRDIWEKMLLSADPKRYEISKPQIDKWHSSFYKIVNTVEEGYSLFPLARHVTVKHGLTYPTQGMIEDQYIKALRVPQDKSMDYKDIFDMAVKKILESWEIVGSAVFGEDKTYLSYFEKSWNLDNGKDEDSTLVYWV